MGSVNSIDHSAFLGHSWAHGPEATGHCGAIAAGNDDELGADCRTAAEGNGHPSGTSAVLQQEEQTGASK